MALMYDTKGINQDIVLDLSMLEGVGLLTRDESKSQILATLHGDASPWWLATVTATYYGIALFEVWDQWIDAPVADTPELNFTATDYSLAVWIYWADTGRSLIVMGRYQVDFRGWELYITKTAGVDYLTLRHHHAGGASNRTGCYSTGWAEDAWTLIGVTRVGGTAQHYRNGVAVPTTVQAGGLIDPATNTTHDLVIGTRFTLDDNWFNGYIWRPRAWSRALTAHEHRGIFELERGWYGL